MTPKKRRLIPLPDSIAELRRNVIDYWIAIAMCDNLGGVSGDLVRETEVRVTELLERGDNFAVYEASRITAEFECIRRLHS